MSNSRPREDDVMSFCGSISGETYSARRRKNTCVLRTHSIANSLRNESFVIKQQDIIALDDEKKSINSIFHYYRFVVVMLGGLSFGFMMLLRFNISVAILNMVNQTALYMEENPNNTVEDFLAEGYELGGEFDWDNEIQNMIMSWYMIAYTLPQVGTTKLGLILGSRLTTPISLSICALATLLTPISAYWGWQWVVALRLINGVGGSAVLPMMLNLIENWMPYEEISLGLTVAQVLQACLTAASPLIAGELAAIHWSYAFYVPAIGTLIFCVTWLLIVTDRPDQNWLVSREELELICGCRDSDSHKSLNGCKTLHSHKSGHDGCNKNNPSKVREAEQQDEDEEAMSERASFVDIFKVPSLYAYILTLCLHCSSYNGFAFVLPAYLRQFLKIEVSENGFYCSLIQAGSILAVMWPHPFLSFLQTKFQFSLTAARRITYGTGCLVAAATWTYVGALHEFQLLLLFLNRCFQGCADVIITGSLMGNYANAGLSSMAFSLVNTVGNFSVVFASTFIGWMLDESGQSKSGWFWIMSILGSAQLLILVIFCSTIRSEPIEFSKPKARRSVESQTMQIEVVVCKKDLGSTTNNSESVHI